MKVGVRDSSYSDFLVDLHQKEGDSEDCRYGLYDYEYTFSPDGTESTFKSKLFLMSWCPDGAKIKKKMLYSSRYTTIGKEIHNFDIYNYSFDTLKRAFVGVHKVIQANDKSECEQVSKKKLTDKIIAYKFNSISIILILMSLKVTLFLIESFLIIQGPVEEILRSTDRI